jgi:hypothetical protein
MSLRRIVMMPIGLLYVAIVLLSRTRFIRGRQERR